MNANELTVHATDLAAALQKIAEPNGPIAIDYKTGEKQVTYKLAFFLQASGSNRLLPPLRVVNEVKVQVNRLATTMAAPEVKKAAAATTPAAPTGVLPPPTEGAPTNGLRLRPASERPSMITLGAAE